MKTKIDDLVQKKDEIRSSLDDLTKVVETQEKEKRQKEIAKKLDNLKKQIDSFSTSDDTEKGKLTTLKSDVDKLSTDLNKIGKELKDLKAGVLADKEDSQTTNSENSSGDTSKQEKGVWEKTKDFVNEQWSDVRSLDKWKEEPGKNLLRAAGLVGTGVAIYKGIKGLWNWAFGDKKEKKKEGDGDSSEKKEEKSFWDSTTGKVIKTTGAIIAVGTGVYYLAHGLYTQNRGFNDLWDWEKGKKLDFNAALHLAEGSISNQDNKEGMSYGLNLKYHEDTSEIEAYGIRVKIDKDKRKIVGTGMDNVSFSKYEHMISTAILIAYLKKNYAGKCKNNAPYSYSGGWSGNVDVNGSEGSDTAADGTGSGGRIVGISAAGIAGIVTGIYGGLQAGTAVGVAGGVVGGALGYAYDTNNILHNHMPEIDSEFGMSSLCSYLNSMNCWQERNQTIDDITESPIKNDVWDCIDKIQNENPDLPAMGGRRDMDAIPDPNHPDRYTIKAWGRSIEAEVRGTDEKTIKILGISGGNPAIKADTGKGEISEMTLPLSEGLYMCAVLGKLLDEYHHKGNEYPRFEYTWRVVDELTSGFGIWGDATGLFFSDPGVDSLALSRERFEKNMPTLAKKGNGEKFLEFLNKGITDEFNVPIWKKSE